MGQHAAAGRHCHVAGWGTLSSGGSSPNKLHDVGINMMHAAYCYEYGKSDFKCYFIRDPVILVLINTFRWL